MKVFFSSFIIILGLVVVIASQALYTVDETDQAIVLQLGQPVGEIKGPGLHAKIPFVQEVRTFDRRILAVDPQPEQMVISSSTILPTKPAAVPLTSDADATEEGTETEGEAQNTRSQPEVFQSGVSGEPIIVDTFARYKINDPLKFLKTLQTIPNANRRLGSIMNDATRSVLGKSTLTELLSQQRTDIMENIRNRVNNIIAKDDFGIEIVDIRIVRADLTPELRQSTVRRMISELKERATETRARGEEIALEISSTAEKERTVILAEADQKAQVTKGQGDNDAIKTYAEAFNKDKEFYDFIRSMEAYKSTLATDDTRLILSPESEFFKYFKQQ